MNRRAFLKGASALAAVAVAAPALPRFNTIPLSYAADAADIAFLERMNQGLVNVLFYGDTDAAPREFIGLPLIDGVVTVPEAPPKGSLVMITQQFDNRPRDGFVTWGRHTIYRDAPG